MALDKTAIQPPVVITEDREFFVKMVLLFQNSLL